MKAKFDINGLSSIKTFLKALEILSGNSTEALIQFHKNGISISQPWQDKDSKYFFFLEDTHFSNIMCDEEYLPSDQY